MNDIAQGEQIVGQGLSRAMCLSQVRSGQNSKPQCRKPQNHEKKVLYKSRYYRRDISIEKRNLIARRGFQRHHALPKRQVFLKCVGGGFQWGCRKGELWVVRIDIQHTFV